MKSHEVGTTLKHPETIIGNVKNLSKIIENEITFTKKIYMIINCLRMLENGSNLIRLHMQKVEF